MSSSRSRVNSLRRTMALEYAIVRLWTLADDYCLEWTVALGERRSPPNNHAFVQRVVAAGYLLPTFAAVHRYLDECRDQDITPDAQKLLLALLPWSHRYSYSAPFS